MRCGHSALWCVFNKFIIDKHRCDIRQMFWKFQVCVRDRLDANCATKCHSFHKLALLMAVLRVLGHFLGKNPTFSTLCLKLTFLTDNWAKIIAQV